MAAPSSGNGINLMQGTNPASSQRPTDALHNTQSTSNAVPLEPGEQPAPGRRKRTHRAGRRRRNRRQSFAAPSDDAGNVDPARSNHDLLDVPISSAARPPFYRLGQSGGGNLSNTSLESEALLDHRYDSRNRKSLSMI